MPLTPLERDVYLAGGSKLVQERDLCNEANVRNPQPDTLSFEPSDAVVEEGASPRVVASLSPERMEELRAAEGFLLTVTASGYGKRSSTHEYRATSRGTSGIAAATLTDQTGPMVSCVLASDDDQLVLITGRRTDHPAARAGHQHLRPHDQGGEAPVARRRPVHSVRRHRADPGEGRGRRGGPG